MHDNMWCWHISEWKLHLHHHANMCRLPCRHIHGHIWQSDVVHRLHRLPLVLLCGCSMHGYLQHWMCVLLWRRVLCGRDNGVDWGRDAAGH